MSIKIQSAAIPTDDVLLDWNCYPGAVCVCLEAKMLDTKRKS